MIVALHIARGLVIALVFACTGGGFLFTEAARGLTRLQKNLTMEIERRRAG